MLRALFSAAKMAFKAIKPLRAERSAGQAPESVRPVDESILEDAIGRLAGGQLEDPLVKRLTNSAAHLLITPKHLDTPNVVNWLKNSGVKADLMSAARMKALGSAIPEELITRLQTRYCDVALANSQEAGGVVAATVAILSESVNARVEDAGTAGLIIASHREISAQVREVQDRMETHSKSEPQITDDVVNRARAMATALFEAGKHSWKLPRFVAPLSLDVREKQEEGNPRSINSEEIERIITDGESLILSGSGGIGKTTYMLDLCKNILAASSQIPMFLDAAIWGGTNASLIEYLSKCPAAKANGITHEELTQLARNGLLVVMLNGWNEISTSSKLHCRDDILQLSTAVKSLSIVVSSRTPNDAPNFVSARQIEVRGLTWDGQAAVVREELGEPACIPLLELLTKDSHLRHAARSPLILRGLVAEARLGNVSNTSVFDLLGSSVRSSETEEHRSFVLSRSAVEGHQGAYLEEIACLITHRGDTNCSREDALRAINVAALQLMKHGLISSPPSLSAILDLLISHSLLHLDGELIRFVHQRFQEYFASCRILRELTENTPSPILLDSVVNHPTWGDALELVAGKVKGFANLAAARARMVNAAAAIDLGFACDIAGACAFSEADDAELHNELISQVSAMGISSLEDVRDLSIAYQIASGLPAFAENLWQLIENPDQQPRLRALRMGGSAISLAQLGENAKHRIALWPTNQRVEMVHEVANNADNYEFLVELALTEPVSAVRVAAISALFWYFPASDLALQAWLGAPEDVQTEHNVMTCIQYALEDGHAGEEVRECLRSIRIDSLPRETRLHLAIAFPAEIGPRVLDTIFARLRAPRDSTVDDPLLKLAQANAPEDLLTLARELTFQHGALPNWVKTYWSQTPDDIKHNAYEEAWSALEEKRLPDHRGHIVGPLADLNQTERCVDAWLRHSGIDIDDYKREQTRDFLSHASGSHLLSAIIKCSKSVNYDGAVHLIDLLQQRVGGDEKERNSSHHWQPSVDETQRLFASFFSKTENTDMPQHALQIYLCCIAGNVACSKLTPFLIETCHLYLKAWSTFHERVELWVANPSSPRPNNPSYGNYLIAAIEKWGVNILPNLLELLDHPCADQLIAPAIVRIVNQPWTGNEKILFCSIGADFQEGDKRRRLGRELRQPDDTIQMWTDDAAKVLGQKLDDLVTTYEQKKRTAEKWDAQKSAYGLARLAGTVAKLSSTFVKEPLHHALTSRLLDLYGTISVLRGLVRQGSHIASPEEVQHLEALHEQVTNTNWMDDQTRSSLADLSILLLFAVPVDLLSKSRKHYFECLNHHSHINEIIRISEGVHSEFAWPVLLELSEYLEEIARPPEELVVAMISALSTQYLPDFVALIANGKLFEWGRRLWMLEPLALKIAAVLSNNDAQIAAFIDACRQAESPLADTLAGETLVHINGREGSQQQFLLEALDVGRAHPGAPAYRMLEKSFVLKQPFSSGQYEVIPKANNELRAQLYSRSKAVGSVADSCRSLLASLECRRRQSGRPDDEPRHPTPGDGAAWTDVLLVR